MRFLPIVLCFLMFTCGRDPVQHSTPTPQPELSTETEVDTIETDESEADTTEIATEEETPAETKYVVEFKRTFDREGFLETYARYEKWCEDNGEESTLPGFAKYLRENK